MDPESSAPGFVATNNTVLDHRDSCPYARQLLRLSGQHPDGWGLGNCLQELLVIDVHRVTKTGRGLVDAACLSSCHKLWKAISKALVFCLSQLSMSLVFDYT